MTARKLKLYVWENVLREYTCGVMFALAYSVADARKLIIKKEGWSKDSPGFNELTAKPRVVKNRNVSFCGEAADELRELQTLV